MPISSTQFLIGAKDYDEPLGENGDCKARTYRRIVSNIAMRLLCGTSSPFFVKLYSDGLVTHAFDFDADYAADTVTILIGGESEDPDAVLEALHEEVASIVKRGFDRRRFETMKKALIGNQLRGLEDFENVCNNLFGDWIDGCSYFDVNSVLAEVSCEDCVAWIRETLAPERLAVSVLRPVKNAS